MRRDWLIVTHLALAATPAAAGARSQAPAPADESLVRIDYRLPDDSLQDARRWLLPKLDEPEATEQRPMLRIRGTRLKMRVPI